MYHRATQISLSIDRVSNYFSYLVHRSENITESEGKKLREKKQKKLYDREFSITQIKKKNLLLSKINVDGNISWKKRIDVTVGK